MRRFFVVVASLLWAVGLFVAVFWLTFPSDTLANRIRYEVPRLLGNEYSADVASVSPWWAGLSVDGIKLYTETTDDEGVTSPQLAAIFDDFSARVGLFSIVSGAPYFKGRVVFPEGRKVNWELGTDMEGGKGVRYSDVVLRSDALPVGDLLAFVGAPSSVDGTASLDLSVRGGENGMRDASGSLAVDGSNLVVSDLEIPGMGPLGMDLPISLVAIHAAIDKGRLTFSEGRIVSEMVTIEVKGDVTLRDPLDRSSVDLEFVLSNLGGQLSSFEGFMGAAKGSDGNYHFHCKGVLSRMSLESSCTSGDDRRSSRATARQPSVTSTSGDGDETPEDKARNKQDIQDRIRKRREEREERRRNGGTTTTAPVVPEVVQPEDEDEDEDEEIPPEDEHIEEELVPEEEEPVE